MSIAPNPVLNSMSTADKSCDEAYEKIIITWNVFNQTNWKHREPYRALCKISLYTKDYVHSSRIIEELGLGAF